MNNHALGHFQGLSDSSDSIDVISLSSDGSDYVAIGPFTLTFNSTIKQFTFEVPVIDDDKFEITESLTISLNFPGGIALPRASIPQPSTQMICLDNDCKLYYVEPSLHERMSTILCWNTIRWSGNKGGRATAAPTPSCRYIIIMAPLRLLQKTKNSEFMVSNCSSHYRE